VYDHREAPLYFTGIKDYNIPMAKYIRGKDISSPERRCFNCHPELVSGSETFVTIRTYEILHQVQNDDLTNALISIQPLMNGI
jgi:hypothetical protein